MSVIGFIGSVCFASYAGFNYILDIVDAHVGNYVIATLGLIEVILICYIYGVEKIRLDANEFSDFKVGRYFNFFLKYVTPVLLGIMVITNLIKELQKLGELRENSYTEFLGEVVFGWGTILVMFVAAFVFYKKRWHVTKKIEEE